MADETPSPARQMSLIPFPYDSREVVLQRGNAVVLYDADSRELSVRRQDASPRVSDKTDTCPLCHRPLHEGGSGGGARDGSPEQPIVDPQYFAMLAESQHPSPAGSGSATPSRRVHLALRSGRSRDVSGAGGPAANPSEPDINSPSGEPLHWRRQGISSSAFSPGYFNQFFREIRELGRGGNGVVLLVEHIIDDVSLGQFACKRIPVGDSRAYFEKVIIEVRLLQKIPHRNIVAYHWTWLEDHQPSKFGPSIPCLWILQDYCNGGDLQSHVLGPTPGISPTEQLKARLRRRSKGGVAPEERRKAVSRLSLDEIFSFFKDITTGLHHLHNKGYIHRDLKPSNCLLRHEDGKTRVLISDFGEVQLVGDSRKSTGATGTVAYLAPEVLQQSPDGSFRNFTTKSDIFSLGMIVYFMCFGRLPYSSTDGVADECEDLDQLRAEITHWPGFNDDSRPRSDLPDKLYRFLKRLLSVDPNERPGTGEILSSINGGVSLGDSVWSSDDLPSPNARIRPRSPVKVDQDHETLARLRRASMALDVRKEDDFLRTSRLSSPQRSPRLMLPPPPPSLTLAVRIARFLHQPRVIFLIRAALFMCKVASFATMCGHHAVQPVLLYLLLGVAAIDLGALPFSLRQSLLLLGLHFATIIATSQHAMLCQSAPMVIWRAG